LPNKLVIFVNANITNSAAPAFVVDINTALITAYGPCHSTIGIRYAAGNGARLHYFLPRTVGVVLKSAPRIAEAIERLAVGGKL
jgi:hypothetical protein